MLYPGILVVKLYAILPVTKWNISLKTRALHDLFFDLVKHKVLASTTITKIDSIYVLAIQFTVISLLRLSCKLISSLSQDSQHIQEEVLEMEEQRFLIKP